ncbi:SusD/RagB family nutrient-binding outer membrane lipoprotein [Danxiaibacter flavus]|uniref:SusD/RagB family nutrient-binding outer membrane lipoprotein n=1 Tax=Danxiaibacter flavus TaxID=3049108 RepID=A0ABV3ZJT2_9BACT|nr:SusD/RagB family nutrient-binding outer membrane lipoprotein [Chitinophagaceae bacterium DXS]
MKQKSSYIIAACIAAAVGQGCTKDFTQINTNPDKPVVAPTTNVFAYVVEDFAATYFDAWGDMNEPETYGGHLGKIQYVDEARYKFRTGTVTSLWNAIYRDMKNAQLVIGQAEKDKAVNMQAAALTIQAYMMQIGTDRWRDMPFSDAIKGDSGYITPKYDTQETIYPAIVNQLKKAADLFAQASDDKLGEGDLLFAGDVTKWRKFCNSLRLRVAIRLSGVNSDLSKSIIEEVTGDAAKYPVFESNDDNAFLIWPGSKPYIEPWNSDSQGRDDHGPSAPFIDTLKKYADPRLSSFAHPAPADGEYRGVEIGPVSSPTISLYSRIGTIYRDVAAGFSPFMRYSEVQFILAEAATRGWNTHGLTAEQAYTNGVMASMAENGVTDANEISAYMNATGVKWTGSVKQIYMQKWIALFKDGHEAWAEERRTDYPLLPAAKGSSYPGHTRPPFRYPYPVEESTLNGGNNATFGADVKDNFWGKQMWWDTRKGVQ